MLQGACTELNERAARTEAALAASQAAHEQTQGALSAETAARTEAEAKVRVSTRTCCQNDQAYFDPSATQRPYIMAAHLYGP